MWLLMQHCIELIHYFDERKCYVLGHKLLDLNRLSYKPPDLITRFSWDVNIQSMHEKEFAVTWVGSLINCCKSNWDRTIFYPSKMFVSLLHNSVGFALKSPKAIIENRLLLLSVSCVNLKLSANISKISRAWQRNLDTFQQSLISKFLHSTKNWVPITFQGKELG